MLDGRPMAACYDPNRDVDQAQLDAAEKHGVELIPFRNDTELESLLQSGRYRRFMSALPYAYHDVDFGDTELVITIHGLRPIEMPTDRFEGCHVKGAAAILKWLFKMAFTGRYTEWRRRQFGRLLQLRAGKLTVIVPSEHTRCSVLEYFPDTDPGLLKMLYSPATDISRVEPSGPEFLARAGLEPGRYILMVSGAQWVKNASRGLEAVVRILEEHPKARGMKVAMVGGAPHRMPSAWRHHLVVMGRIGASELARCFADAYCLFYPTLNEGFGYPPLESMARGTPVLCSAITSTTEILGDAALYFSPTSIPEMRNRLCRVLGDADLYDELVERGYHHHELMAARQSAMLDELCAMLLEE